jgi:hypothetical protein
LSGSTWNQRRNSFTSLEDRQLKSDDLWCRNTVHQTRCNGNHRLCASIHASSAMEPPTRTEGSSEGCLEACLPWAALVLEISPCRVYSCQPPHYGWPKAYPRPLAVWPFYVQVDYFLVVRHSAKTGTQGINFRSGASKERCAGRTEVACGQYRKGWE